jgi:hypothetical protein
LFSPFIFALLAADAVHARAAARAALFCHGDYEFSMPLTPLMMFS